MEKMGVISKIITPTSWCAAMVVVPKKSGAVRICVDLKPLNESVLREPHPIPKVDDTVAHYFRTNNNIITYAVVLWLRRYFS